MSMRSGPITAVWLAFSIAAGAAFAEGPNLGKPLDAAAIAAWDISIEPDGTGLPPGTGTPADGARITRRSVPSATARTAKAGSLALQPRLWSVAARSPTSRRR
jgi:hypothetical protein